MAEDIKSHKEDIDNISGCCEDLVSNAETDQQLVTEELNRIIARYEELGLAAEGNLEKGELYQEKVNEFQDRDVNFVEWLAAMEKSVSEFDPIILEDDFLEKKMAEAQVK